MNSTPDLPSEPDPQQPENPDPSAPAPAPAPAPGPDPSEPPQPPTGPPAPPIPPTTPPASPIPQTPGAPHGGWPGAPAPRSGLSFGAGIGVGTAVGCGSMLIALMLFFGLANLGTAFSIGAFVLPLILGAVLLIWPKTRGIGVGVLIIAAAAWIVVIGPCLGLLNGA